MRGRSIRLRGKKPLDPFTNFRMLPLSVWCPETYALIAFQIQTVVKMLDVPGDSNVSS